MVYFLMFWIYWLRSSLCNIKKQQYHFQHLCISHIYQTTLLHHLSREFRNKMPLLKFHSTVVMVVFVMMVLLNQPSYDNGVSKATLKKVLTVLVP